MRPLNRHGVTLVELLLVLVMALAVATAAHQVVRLAAETAAVARAHNAAARDAVTVWALLNHDLRAAARIDLTSPVGNTLDLPRPVGEGPVCHSTATTTRLRWHGDRLPDADRDRAWLRHDSIGGDWIERGIVSVTMANCPDGGSAVELTFATAIPPIALVRVAEPSRMRSYPSGGQYWLGLEPRLSVATIQPLAGPIAVDGFDVALSANSIHLRYSRAPLPPLALTLPLSAAP